MNTEKLILILIVILCVAALVLVANAPSYFTETKVIYQGF
jgi:hypothetical protein